MAKSKKREIKTGNESDEEITAEDVDLENIKVGKDRPSTLPGDAEWYPAKFIKANVQDGKHGPIVFLQFKLLGGKNEEGERCKDVQVSALAGYDTAPSSKFMGFVANLRDDELETDEEIDLKSLYGDKYDVFVEIKDTDKGQLANVSKIAEYKSKYRPPVKRKKKKKRKGKKSKKK